MKRNVGVIRNLHLQETCSAWSMSKENEDFLLYCLFNEIVTVFFCIVYLTILSLFFSVLFNDTVSTSDDAVSNHRVINYELVKMWKEFDVCVTVHHIQGDSGGICNTLGNDSICDSKQKVQMNMGPILDGYGVMGIY